MNETSMKTGELARQASVNVETLRFYERKGLLPKPPRRNSGYREYPPESVQRLRFIKRAQELGFSLAEIKELLTLRVMRGTTCGQVRERAQEKVVDVQQKISDLRTIEAALAKLVKSCSGRGPASRCPILDHLDEVQT